MKKLLSQALAKILNGKEGVYVWQGPSIRLYYKKGFFHLVEGQEDGDPWDLLYYEQEGSDSVWVKPVREEDVLSFALRWTSEMGDKLL